MSQFKSSSILQVIKDIEKKLFYLPALQRKFVWRKYQIELLFDSIMRGYPIGTFLFWRLHKDNAANYVFYEFLKKYDDRNPYNEKKLGEYLLDEIVGVLDGQQRMSSLYVALQGSHTEKLPYKRKSSDDAYPETFLYVNLLAFPYKIMTEDELGLVDDKNFEFKFLTESESMSWTARTIIEADGDMKTRTEERMLWFKVGKVLSWGPDTLYESKLAMIINDCPDEELKIIAQNSDIKRFIVKGLGVLHSRLVKEEIINYFEVVKDELEDVLKIFVRVNSAGTQLSKTDLLFSTIVATWNDGRKEIEEQLKAINSKGLGFCFTIEYLMRCCLVLTDAPVLFKVNSFKSENVAKIQSKWVQIAQAVSRTVDLLVEFGFSGETLTSQNATIIIAYYLFHGGECDSANSKNGLKMYLVHALISGMFGSSQDQVLAALRNNFRTEIKDERGIVIGYKGKYKKFSFEDMIAHELPASVSMKISKLDLDELLKTRKGPRAFAILNLLYPWLKYEEVQFHQDHIHPVAKFTTEELINCSIPAGELAKWLEMKDMIPNLQIMEGKLNVAKNDLAFSDWFNSNCKTPEDRTIYAAKNYLPTYSADAYRFENFLAFFEARRKIIKEKLMSILHVIDDNNIDREWDEVGEDGE